MNDPNIHWPAYKFGMSQEDIKTKLHRQYNTIVMPVLDIEAFSYDVSEIANKAENAAEFHALLAERKKKRVVELREALELMMSEISYNDHLLPRSSMDSALTVFRDRSFDAMVRFCSTFIPKDVLNDLNHTPTEDEPDFAMPDFSEDYWEPSDHDDHGAFSELDPLTHKDLHGDEVTCNPLPSTSRSVESNCPCSPSDSELSGPGSDTDSDSSSVSDFDATSPIESHVPYFFSQEANYDNPVTHPYSEDYRLDEDTNCHLKYDNEADNEAMHLHSKSPSHELSNEKFADYRHAFQSSLKEKAKKSSQNHKSRLFKAQHISKTTNERPRLRSTSPEAKVVDGRVNKLAVRFK
ncbi:hypothetical protein CFIMG_008567RA00001 [Ceratocystis fimbriata CBS 114723]|uniref:Uncharacterized protein n=1 Tax=Ceratocystis fimbriata CBS 114723 TaxID=1035309 RepID=A0A2C5X1B7_9PEZI|nr:hypothetical protein CFIMG_008567RA00001 [Ceratocystis fimbriata CBS 114723]